MHSRTSYDSNPVGEKCIEKELHLTVLGFPLYLVAKCSDNKSSRSQSRRARTTTNAYKKAPVFLKVAKIRLSTQSFPLQNQACVKNKAPRTVRVFLTSSYLGQTTTPCFVASDEIVLHNADRIAIHLLIPSRNLSVYGFSRR